MNIISLSVLGPDLYRNAAGGYAVMVNPLFLETSTEGETNNRETALLNPSLVSCGLGLRAVSQRLVLGLSKRRLNSFSSKKSCQDSLSVEHKKEIGCSTE